jgi:HSP20 family molecular chaperone IbpA
MRMQAELKQGVLKVRIHKADHAKPRRIQVNG